MKKFTAFLFVCWTLPLVAAAKGIDFTIANPISANSLERLISTVLNVLLILAVPVVVFFIILAGFNYVTAQGNPAKITKAHWALINAIVGGLLILGGVVLGEIIGQIIQSFAA